ncbi:Metalloenzyme, LuxS/M16 peptidase-like protein [Pseudocohnilembus persalinus]|uniref:Metalloenzyme, LuxS/M16 peptidase-like protein n=1 Tax=Pseudocohnilembus persalinus TaxID=266149 RepID=A0A0V0QNM3_PSEPJ|nr:Metalloenzyme, LuxS/M16 peptidase-like protein [Pseudocohnilembus persalinus]|eukprot:KRX03740.1 Metalloenzyme, LuxS/M16 peptidase-like protein [Pseudocohnilembus persalinus]
MLSKVVQNTTKNLVQQTKQSVSVKRMVMDALYKDDSSDVHFKATHLSPRQPLAGHKGKQVTEGNRQWQSTKLSNGITVLSESTGVPGAVDMGILLNVGTRDETVESSGSLLSIKNTYMKTLLNTNETINYGMVQMTGGHFEMKYDQETALFHASCLAHDTVDIFNMVADCALEPRSVVASQVGQSKNQDTHKLDSFLKTGEHFNEALFQTAYGLQGLGMPLKGLKGNIDNLTSYNLQKFQLENITPNRMIVAGTGIDSHEEFVQLVTEKLGFLPATEGSQVLERAASEYRGGEVRNLNESNRLDLALVFQGVNWSSEDVAALNVLRTLLNGQRIQTNLLNKNHFIDSAEALNFHFSDSGLFGLRVSGSSANGKQILDSTIGELKEIASQVSQSEVEAAKSALQVSVATALQRQCDRLEEGVKSFNQYGEVKIQQYAQQINSVTADQISNAVQRLLQSNPTFVVEGNNANNLPSFDQIRNSLN